jgi:hypothetical protein
MRPSVLQLRIECRRARYDWMSCIACWHFPVIAVLNLPKFCAPWRELIHETICSSLVLMILNLVVSDSGPIPGDHFKFKFLTLMGPMFHDCHPYHSLASTHQLFPSQDQPETPQNSLITLRAGMGII